MTQHTVAPSSSPLFEKISKISARLEQVSPLNRPTPALPQENSQKTSGGTRFASSTEETATPLQPWKQNQAS